MNGFRRVVYVNKGHLFNLETAIRERERPKKLGCYPVKPDSDDGVETVPYVRGDITYDLLVAARKARDRCVSANQLEFKRELDRAIRAAEGKV